MNEVTKTFQDRMDETRDGCEKIARGTRGEQIKWMFDGSGKSTEKVGKFDGDARHEHFSREEAAKNYYDAVEDATADAEEGTPSKRTRQETALAKVQSDYLSGMERDLHQRHRGRVRMLAHESTSRRHAGSSKGVIQANMMEYLQTQKQRIDAAKGGVDDNS